MNPIAARVWSYSKLLSALFCFDLSKEIQHVSPYISIEQGNTPETPIGADNPTSCFSLLEKERLPSLSLYNVTISTLFSLGLAKLNELSYIPSNKFNTIVANAIGEDVSKIVPVDSHHYIIGRVLGVSLIFGFTLMFSFLLWLVSSSISSAQTFDNECKNKISDGLAEKDDFSFKNSAVDVVLLDSTSTIVTDELDLKYHINYSEDTGSSLMNKYEGGGNLVQICEVINDPTENVEPKLRNGSKGQLNGCEKVNDIKFNLDIFTASVKNKTSNCEFEVPKLDTPTRLSLDEEESLNDKIEPEEIVIRTLSMESKLLLSPSCTVESVLDYFDIDRSINDLQDHETLEKTIEWATSDGKIDHEMISSEVQILFEESTTPQKAKDMTLKFKLLVRLDLEKGDSTLNPFIQYYHSTFIKYFDNFLQLIDKNNEVSNDIMLLLRDIIIYLDVSSVDIQSYRDCLKLLLDSISEDETRNKIVSSCLFSITCALALSMFAPAFFEEFDRVFKEEDERKQIVAIRNIKYYTICNRENIANELRKNYTKNKSKCCSYSIVRIFLKNIKTIRSKGKEAVNSALIQEVVDMYLVLYEVYLNNEVVPSSIQFDLSTGYFQALYTCLCNLFHLRGEIKEPTFKHTKLTYK